MGRKKISFPKEAEALLGTVPDQQVADAIGASVTTVYKRRSELGIQPSRPAVSRAQAFSEFLRDELKRLGVTQAEAAELFGVSQSLVEAWIAGPEKSWGRTPSKLERAGIMKILNNKRRYKQRD